MQHQAKTPSQNTKQPKQHQPTPSTKELRQNKRMVLSLPAVALVLLTKAELFVATCLIVFDFVATLRRCWKDIRYILGDARYLPEVCLTRLACLSQSCATTANSYWTQSQGTTKLWSTLGVELREDFNFLLQCIVSNFDALDALDEEMLEDDDYKEHHRLAVLRTLRSAQDAQNLLRARLFAENKQHVRHWFPMRVATPCIAHALRATNWNPTKHASKYA